MSISRLSSMIARAMISFLVSGFLVVFGGVLEQAKAKGSDHPKATKKVAQKEKLPLPLLSKVSQKYRTTKGAQMKLEKKVVLSVLGQDRVSSGELKVSNGKLRLEMLSPNRSLLVFDKENLWFEESSPPEFGPGSVQVGRLDVKKNSKDQALLAFLLGDEKVWGELNLKSKEEKDKTLLLVTEPRQASRFSNIRELSLKLLPETLAITEIAYKDELGNQTKYSFSKVEFDTKLPASLFEYKPPKGAAISEYQ